MNRHERRKQRAQERRGTDRMSSVPVVLLEGETKKRFQADMMSDESSEVFDRICQLLCAWYDAHPSEVLEWHERDEGAVMVGPLGEPEAQRLLAKNDAAMALLAWLDEQTGGKAMTLHARIAIEYIEKIKRDRTATIESDGFRLFDAYAHSRGKVTRIPESPCPFCGVVMGGCSAGTAEVPEPGCPTICVACGGISTFAEDLSVRRMTDAERAEWAEENPKTYQEAQDASTLFRAAAMHGGKPPTGQA